MLESLDESVGRILKKLDDLKLSEHHRRLHVRQRRPGDHRGANTPATDQRSASGKGKATSMKEAFAFR